ncbi:MAG: serine esterase [Bdellovibrionales bacterium]|nr:serine esterase [Bdellovibrionales bacterium]
MFDYPPFEKIDRLQVIKQYKNEKAPTVIMLHGYGANAYDLWSLHRELDPSGQCNWYFPDGCLELKLMPNYTGRAWFPINERALDQAMREGRSLDFSRIYPPGMDRARDLVLGMIAELKVLPGSLILGGFSQGSMLALEVALNLPQKCRGLILFSSGLVNADETARRAKAVSPFYYFQSHGLQDSILPVEGGERLRELLEQQDWNCEWMDFKGGHEIPRQIIEGARRYLGNQLKGN